MYLGKLCEVAPSDDLYRAPMHPYTNVLLASIPVPDPEAPPTAVDVVGEPPSPVLPPSGCRFHPALPDGHGGVHDDRARAARAGHGHFVACHHPVLESPVAVDVGPTPTTQPARPIWAGSSGGILRSGRPAQIVEGTVGT